MRGSPPEVILPLEDICQRLGACWVVAARGLPLSSGETRVVAAGHRTALWHRVVRLVMSLVLPSGNLGLGEQESSWNGKFMLEGGRCEAL